VVTDLQSMLEKHGATQLLFSARWRGAAKDLT
jgi:hypothetical protein